MKISFEFNYNQSEIKEHKKLMRVVGKNELNCTFLIKFNLF